jgi:hypothetical protein
MFLSAVYTIFLTIPVREDICELSADDAVNEEIVNESSISCKALFRELCQMMELQPAIREYRLAQKRSEKKYSKSQNTASQLSSGIALRLCDSNNYRRI